MNCQDFQGKVVNFIEDSLEPELYGKFVYHAKNCSDCYDELEIHYMIQVGLERMDNDMGQSLDLKSELKTRLEFYEQKSETMFVRDLYRHILCVVSQCCTLVLFILQILIWLHIL